VASIGVTIQAFEEATRGQPPGAADELVVGKFIPSRIRKFESPREMVNTVPWDSWTVRDKIVQQAVRDILEPILERLFLNVSYGYRKEKGAARAIGRVNHLIVTKNGSG